jgi:acyl-CoA thioesterase-1
MWFPRLNWKGRPHRSYGEYRPGVKIGRRLAAVTLAAMLAHAPAGPAARAADRPVRIVAFGDSLTAGYGLAADEAFPVRLQRALAAKGVATEIANAGVSGDTTSGGLARLDWSVPDGTDAVILELGANDALRGIDPKVTRGALDAMLRRLRERHIAVLLCGMLAPRNLGADYGAAFDAVYPDLAREYGVALYPFFLDGVATAPKLNQRDGLHPTAAGVDVIVANILPAVERLVAQARDQARAQAAGQVGGQADTSTKARKSP